jgi:hypothetical protein
MAVEIQKEYRHSEQGGMAMGPGSGDMPDEGLESISGPASTRVLRVSVLQGGKTWYSQTHDDLAADGAVIRRSEELEVGDGEWLRKRWMYSGAWPGGRPPPEGVTLRLSGASGAGVHRPHAVFDRDYKGPRPLSVLLTSKWEDEINKYGMEVQYLGEDDRDGHPCEVVKLSTMIPPAASPYYIRLVWLAKDRNYLAIRMEGHEPKWSPALPTALYTAGDLREISPGVWFPHRHWMIAFKKGSETDLAEGRLAVLHRTDYRVQSVKLNPEVPPETFTEFIVPGGTKVEVVDTIGRHVGQLDQEKDGTPTVSREKYQRLVDEASKAK